MFGKHNELESSTGDCVDSPSSPSCVITVTIPEEDTIIEKPEEEEEEKKGGGGDGCKA